MTSKTDSSLDMIHVEVIYALAHEQKIFEIVTKKEAKVQDIIAQSGILDYYPEIDLTKNQVGVFSRQVKLDACVEDMDRIEIYRPLLADPKEIRRKRAAQMAKNKKK